MDSEIVFSRDVPSQTISDSVRRGKLRLLARGIYTTDLGGILPAIVARHWHIIVGRAFPDAVITDRSALTGGRIEGYLYLAHGARPRELALPGLHIIARQGAGPLDNDLRLPGGLYVASRARSLAENMKPSRSRGDRPRRTLNDHEIDAWVDRLCRLEGEARLTEYRRQTELLGPRLGISPERIGALGRKIGAAVGTQSIATSNRALAARQAGLPFDPDRVGLLDRLIVSLRSAAPQSRLGLDAGSNAFAVQAFYEAYFSNYIEGTTFTVDEARAIVYDGELLAGRTADSHDLLGTYRIVADADEMNRVAAGPDEFLGLLRSRHATLMAGRPRIAGIFKLEPNQAGQTLFVQPELVHGTLQEGWLGALTSTPHGSGRSTRCSSSPRSIRSSTATVESRAS